MILADTDILSALAKIGRLPLLLALFRGQELRITPAVLRELEHSFALGRQYAIDLFAVLTGGQISIAYLTPAEAKFRDALPITLAAGERESLAVAKERAGTVLSNESRVAHYCQQYEIPCLRLPDILRALWLEGIVSKADVRNMIDELGMKDRMQFKQSVLDAILADSAT